MAGRIGRGLTYFGSVVGLSVPPGTAAAAALAVDLKKPKGSRAAAPPAAPSIMNFLRVTMSFLQSPDDADVTPLINT
jgi:hypothetical protein